MNDAKLTVGIPTFNRAEWLRESIESVLAQSYTNVRLLVCDNGSDDDTPDVVRSFGDERVHYVRNERNIGSVGNINRLIEIAETEYLMLLPDDDILYPGHLEATVGVLERHKSVGLVHTAFNFIDAESQVIRSVKPVKTLSRVKIHRHDDALEWLMGSPWGLCFSSVVYRTKVIVDAGGLRDEAPFGDRQIWMRIALGWDFGYVAEPLTGLRTHDQTITSDIAVKHGGAPTGRLLVLRYSELIFDRRMDFLGEAPLEPGQTRRYRALARLQLLAESAWNLPWTEVAVRLANVARTYPRIMLRPGFWRLLAAQLGGRRLLAALRRLTPRDGVARG